MTHLVHDEVFCQTRPADCPDCCYAALPSEAKERVRRWITKHIVARSRASASTSYTWKHSYEHSPDGEYLTNGAFKGAMLASGYTPSNPRDINWRFRAKLVDAPGWD